MRTISWVVVTVVVFGLLLGLQYRRTQTSPIDLESLGYFQLAEPAELPAVRLSAGHGAQGGLETPGGKWTIVFFGFTHCPDVCPTTMSILNIALGDLENGPRVAMVTVDPARDTPDLVSEYAKAFNPAFVGLGGTPADIRQLADAVGIAFETVTTETGYTIEHSGALVVLDPAGLHRGYIRPPLRPANIRDIAAAVMIVD